LFHDAVPHILNFRFPLDTLLENLGDVFIVSSPQLLRGGVSMGWLMGLRDLPTEGRGAGRGPGCFAMQGAGCAGYRGGAGLPGPRGEKRMGMAS